MELLGIRERGLVSCSPVGSGWCHISGPEMEAQWRRDGSWAIVPPPLKPLPVDNLEMIFKSFMVLMHVKICIIEHV